MSGTWGWEATDRNGDAYEGGQGMSLAEAAAEAGYELAVADEVSDVWLLWYPTGGEYGQRRGVVRRVNRRPGSTDPWTAVEWDRGCDPDTPPAPPSPAYVPADDEPF